VNRLERAIKGEMKRGGLVAQANVERMNKIKML